MVLFFRSNSPIKRHFPKSQSGALFQQRLMDTHICIKQRHGLSVCLYRRTHMHAQNNASAFLCASIDGHTRMYKTMPRPFRMSPQMDRHICMKQCLGLSCASIDRHTCMHRTMPQPFCVSPQMDTHVCIEQCLSLSVCLYRRTHRYIQNNATAFSCVPIGGHTCMYRTMSWPFCVTLQIVSGF